MKSICRKVFVMILSICLVACPTFASNVKVSPKTGQKAIRKSADKKITSDDDTNDCLNTNTEGSMKGSSVLFLFQK